jgi:hypothetical protein
MFLSAEQRLADSADMRVLSAGANSSALVHTTIPNNVFVPPASFVTIVSAEGGGGQIYTLSVITEDA